MIEIEVEDDAWTEALPDVEAVGRRAAEAALLPLSRDAGEVDRRLGVETEGVCAGRPTPPQSSAAQPTAPPLRGRAEDVITLLLTDASTVRELNARFRGRDAATNVLSFPAAPSAAPHLGDVALAFGVCADEARAQGKPLAHHLQHLVAHGVLHLLGWDHQDEAEAEAMEATERAILAALGVPDPYADPTPGRAPSLSDPADA